jgi:8-oxo-dGTP pyrophosphatase MutT (NUDIX family)
MEQGSQPRQAATVILTRDRAQGDMEVFLMRRHRDQAFMGGAFVFPGGSIDNDDVDPELAEYITGPGAAEAAERLREPNLPGSIALGLYMAAIRETFEEAGILLAYDESGCLLQFGDPALCARFVEARRDVYGKKYTQDSGPA